MGKMISKERVQDILKNKGIVLEKIATDQRVYDKACVVAYKAIPIPLRWFVGKKRIRSLVDTIKGNIVRKV